MKRHRRSALAPKSAIRRQKLSREGARRVLETIATLHGGVELPNTSPQESDSSVQADTLSGVSPINAMEGSNLSSYYGKERRA